MQIVAAPVAALLSTGTLAAHPRPPCCICRKASVTTVSRPWEAVALCAEHAAAYGRGEVQR